MRKLVILGGLLLYSLNSIAADRAPCTSAVDGNKRALIDALVCVEDYNKRLILQRNSYESLLRVLRGQDGSDCLAIRCINDHELSIEVSTTTPSTLAVEFGDGMETIVTSGKAVTVRFHGIIGNMPDALTDFCHSNSMSYLQLRNDSNQAVTISSIKLTLRAPDSSEKDIFVVSENLNKELDPNKSFQIAKNDIMANKAFTIAAAGSCHD